MGLADLERSMARLGLDAPRKTYSKQSAREFREACLVLRRRGVPAGLAEVHLAPYALLRRAPRAPHPTNRRGHPLPPLIQALYHSQSGRARESPSRRRADSWTPPRVLPRRHVCARRGLLDASSKF